MRCIIVTHLEELSSHDISKKVNLTEKNLGRTAGTNDWTTFEDVDVSMSTKDDTSPNEKFVNPKQAPLDYFEEWFGIPGSLHMRKLLESLI